MIFGINENATDRVVTDGSGIVLVKSIMNELIAAFALFVDFGSVTEQRLLTPERWSLLLTGEPLVPPQSMLMARR